MRKKKNKTSRRVQNDIFRNMSAEKKVRLASELSDFCLKLNKIHGGDQTRKIIKTG